MSDIIMDFSSAVSGIVWGPCGLALLFGSGLYMTVRTRAFQLRYIGLWMRRTVGAVFTDKAVTGGGGSGEAMTQFQSMCTALAGTIGTGNIIGVAAGIVGGGAGAVFWMWVMALLGMMTSFAENVLGVYYRRRGRGGEWLGGAMYYLEYGLGSKKGCRELGLALARLFAFFCLLASFGIGNLSQSNSIASNLSAAFGVPRAASGAAIAAATALILLGGLRRVARVTEKLVPFMALFYIVGALVVIAVNRAAVPSALEAIFRGAFCARAVGGGCMAQAISWGFKRGAFSNEAGLGSSVMANSCADVSEPVQQGMWGIFEVFADTIVVCTLTALVLLTSGCALDGGDPGALVGRAFGAVFGGFGPKFIAVSILLFAYSTILGWSHYGLTAAGYLFGGKAAALYKAAFPLAAALGAVMELEAAWSLSDAFNGLMMIPNLIAVLALSDTVVQITRNYLDRVLNGKALKPMLSAYTEQSGHMRL